ncbi:hypothetical protein VMCG_07814 [Cytospora schulzeri]|uniref:Caspase family p20 domain-containing protein n=1 Tax=Cytospora schulzeri TaxID=448051 RepID=A0A423VZN7_9PEZI|nr:hypothetical protein VMCG_07814 [Valsa malicola]
MSLSSAFVSDESDRTDTTSIELIDCPNPCIHHPISHKAPDGLDFPHLNSLKEFVADFADGIKNVFPRRTRNYDRAHALFISWDDDDLDTEGEIVDLEALLKEHFRFTAEAKDFTTSHFKIPSKEYCFQLLEGELVFRRNLYALEESDLLIIYYGGHGKLDKQGHAIWYAFQGPSNAKGGQNPASLDWTRLQGTISQCDGNILLILDSCYATTIGGFHSEWKGIKELLAASGKHDRTTGVSSNSFTRAIIRELKQLQ